MNKDKLYLWNKGLWLLMQALVLPLSAVYLSSVPPQAFPNELIKLLFELAGAFLLILWLIAQALLIMHRFPLRLTPALRLTGGYLLSFVIIWTMEGTLLFAAYASFFTTLLATTTCGLIIYFQALRLGKFSAKQLLIALLVLVLALLVNAGFFLPLLHGMDYILSLSSLVTISLIGINTISTTRALWEKTIFSDSASDESEQYKAEWNRWAGPTIITLILSATAALVVFIVVAD